MPRLKTKKMKQVLKNTIEFIPYFIGILFMTLFVITLIYAPKGTDYIKWEKQMIESNQMTSEESIYFNTNN